MQRLKNIKPTSLPGILLAVMVLLCSFSRPLSQEGDATSESTVKALFIYNFTKHIEWPASVMNGPRFTIATFGENDVKERLVSVLKGRKLFDKSIEIRAINNTEEISGIHILYIGKTQSATIDKIIQQYGDKGILIITEEKGLSSKGAGINLIRKGDNLRFEINEIALRKAGLKVSNQLISLAISSR